MQYADAVISVRITCGGPLSLGGGRKMPADMEQLGAANWALVPGGWRVQVADSTRPNTWYDVSQIRSLIERTDHLSLLEWANRIWAKIGHAFFSARRFLTDIESTAYFVKENWALIRSLFSDRRREATHARLARLMM